MCCSYTLVRVPPDPLLSHRKKNKLPSYVEKHSSVWDGTTHPHLGPGFSVVFVFIDVYLTPTKELRFIFL